jgi:hypothetical protein
LLLSSLLANLASLLRGVHKHMHAHARMYCQIIITIAILIIIIIISIIIIVIIVIIIIINIISIFCTCQYSASKRAMRVFEHASNRPQCRFLCNHTCTVSSTFIGQVNDSQEQRAPTRVAAVRLKRKKHPSVASCMLCISQLRHIDVLVVVFDMFPTTSQRQPNAEAGFWVSKINPKPKDALRHQLLVPERGVVYELRFGLPRLVKIQVPKPCCSQSGDTTLRD